MTLTLVKNKQIRSNKKKFDSFLENFHENSKEFTIDCEYLNIDFFNSESIVKVRHRKPAKDSIYYTEIYKEKDESAYFFGLGRENVIATSSYLDRGSKIRPILVAILNMEDHSKSNLVFAEDSDNYNNVILLKIDCNELTPLQLKVIKDKNKISKLNDGKGYINFGAIGDFKTLTNIRNFISNVNFVYEGLPFIKITDVSIPENYEQSNNRPNDSIVKDRFINFGKLSVSGEDVFDSNELDKQDTLENTKGLDKQKGLKSSDAENSLSSNLNGAIDDLNKILDDADNESENESSDVFESNTIDIEISDENQGTGKSISDSIPSCEDENEGILNEELNLYKCYSIYDMDILFDLSIYRKDFFEIIQFMRNIVDLYDVSLDQIEVLDMDDDILNISIKIHADEYESIDLINRILNKKGFTNLGK